MSKKKNHSIEKNIHYNRLYSRYKLLALDVFEWTNLPNGIESRHIEKQLFEYGQAFFYKDDILGLNCLASHNNGNLNIHGEPTTLNVVGFGLSKVKKVSEGVRILNNDEEIATHLFVHDYSLRMLEVERSINTNIKQQKFPFFIHTNQNNELTVKNLYKKFDDDEFVIFGGKGLDINTIQVLNTNAPYIVDKLNAYKYELEREILSFFGLNNNFEKKERLVVDEVNSNNDYIQRNVELQYRCRKNACCKINEMFGTNIQVILNNSVKESVVESDPKGDNENE